MSAKSSVSGSFNFVDRTIEAFSKILGEIDERGGELDFRESFLRHFVRDILDWKKEKGEGHYITREKEDIRLHNDADDCIALIETKNPKNKLKKADRGELEDHLDDFPMARYGMLTNGHQLKFFKYRSEDGLNKLVSINMDEFVSRGVESLTKSERQDIYLLRRLVRGRCIKAKPKEFTENAQKISVEGKFDLFIEDLRYSLDELTWIIGRLFRFYWKASHQHYGGRFLREDAYKKWKGASTGKEEELREKFCRETAYVFLNRILFTRILEDKKIIKRVISGKEFADLLIFFGDPAYETALKRAYENVEKFYEHFYELGIFDWWRLSEEKRGMLTDEEGKVQEEIEKELFTVVIRDVLRNLNKYNFREVDRDILGDVYQEYLPPEERKRLGEFYTPIEVVRYILDAIGYIPENRIEDKSILDPACGSGTFLVEASNRLMVRYDKKGLKLRDPDDCKTILSAITNKIHGLDINPFACHIAEMNLLFTVIDLLNAVQRKYKDYKLDRFNISQADSLIPPGDEIKKIEDFENGRVKAYAEEAKQSREIKKRKYDFIVGNPPYVRVQTLPKEIRKKYSETYKTAFGNYDIYIPFLERGVTWLSDDGKLGYITPNRFAAVNYGRKIRKFLVENTDIIEFLDFRDTGVFEDVLNYPVILIVAKKESEKNVIKTCRMVHKPEDIGDKEVLIGLREHLKKISTSTDFSSTKMFDVFGYKQDMLTEEGWYLMPPVERNILRKIEKVSTRLVELSKTKKSGSALSEGSSTGAKKIYVVKKLEEKDGLSKFLCLDDESTYTIETGLLRRYAEDPGKWHPIETDDFLIFPYFKEGENYVIIPLDKVSEEYPVALRYFKQKKSKLTGRKGFGKKKNWHAYSAPRSLDYYEEEKILVRGFSVLSSASLDVKGEYFFGPDIYGLRVKDRYKDKSRYILAIINSMLTNFYIRHVGVVHGSGYYKFEDRFIKNLPIKLPETSEEKEASELITQKVGKIIEITKCSGELSKKIERFPKFYSLENFEKLADRADVIDLGKERYSIKDLVIKELEGGGFELSFGKGDRVGFATREMTEFVFEWLKDKSKIKRKELLDFEIPSEKEVVKVMNEFFRDKEKVKELKSKRDKLEKEIDYLVYELYGLDEKDQKIIEEFLEKF